MARSSNKQQPLPQSVQAQIEQVWQVLGDDPERQALECAALCQANAPHLASWLKTKIYAQLPDTLLRELVFSYSSDGRIQALSLLSRLTEGKHTTRPPMQDAGRPGTVRVGRKKKLSLRSFDHNYQTIFGVFPQVVAATEERCLRSDPELGRLSVALFLAHQYRFWIVGRELTRQANGSGRISKKALKQQLAFYGIGYTDRQFRRLIAAGVGRFWRADYNNPDHLYLQSWKRVSLAIVDLAEELCVEVGYNRPGTQEQLIDVSGSLEVWEARLYAGWIAHRDGSEGLSISRVRQAMLFGRSEKTIRQWEKQHLKRLLHKRADYEQHPDDQCSPEELYELQAYIPDHAQSYTAQTRQGMVTRRFWQRPNTYSSNTAPHTHRGQARKVRRAVNHVLSAGTDGGPLRANYTVPEHLKRVKSYKFRSGRAGAVNEPVHVYLGVDRRHRAGKWELMLPDPAQPYPKTGVSEWRPAR